jgi:hypothetical protein
MNLHHRKIRRYVDMYKESAVINQLEKATLAVAFFMRNPYTNLSNHTGSGYIPLHHSTEVSNGIRTFF